MTLQEVYLSLPNHYSKLSAEKYVGAFKRVERLTGRKLHQLPANDVAWSEIASRIVWAGEFTAASPRAAEAAFHEWTKMIGRAIRKASADQQQEETNPDARLAWDLIVDYAKKNQNRPGPDGAKVLPGMADVSLATLRSRVGHVAPAQLDTAAATEALAQIPPDKASSYRRALRLFDKMAADRHRHAEIAALLPATPISPLPGMRDAALKWETLPPSLVTSCDSAIERAILGERAKRDRFGGKLGADPMPRRIKGRRKVRNPDAARKAHRNALSWLIRHAWEDRTEACHIERLDDLLTAEHVQNAADRFHQRAAQNRFLKATDETSSLNSILSRLETLAGRNGIDGEVLDTIAELRFSDLAHSDYAREMAADRVAFLKLLDRDPAIVRAILTGPRVLAREAQRGLDDWQNLAANARAEALHMAMVSTAMALQLSRPLRTRNINELTCGGEAAELLLPRRAGTLATIDIPREKVKNNREIVHDLPRPQWQVITLWLEKARNLWCENHGIHPDLNPYLFPGLKDSAPVSRGTLNKVWNRGMSRIGVIGLKPHMMRHVGATLFIAQNPGQHGVVADLLCDRIQTAEAFYSRGPGKEAAQLFAEVISRLDPTLNLF